MVELNGAQAKELVKALFAIDDALKPLISRGLKKEGFPNSLG